MNKNLKREYILTSPFSNNFRYNNIKKRNYESNVFKLWV